MEPIGTCPSDQGIYRATLKGKDKERFPNSQPPSGGDVYYKQYDILLIMHLIMS